jgi:glutaminase
MEAVDVYTRQCSIGVTAKQLAVMGATLANAGINPLTKKRVLDAKYIPKILAIMMMAGFYNESGKWAFTAGYPRRRAWAAASSRWCRERWRSWGFRRA